MSLESEVKLLRNVPLLSKLEASKLKLLAFASEWLTFDADEVLCRQGEMGDAAYIIIEGEADILVDSPQGPVNVSTRTDGDVIGEIAILCDVPRTATVQARKQLVVLKVSKEVFMQMVTGYPDVAVEVIRTLADRLAITTAELTRTASELKSVRAAGAANPP
jgi:CRP-like cAMP-binding protein